MRSMRRSASFQFFSASSRFPMPEQARPEARVGAAELGVVAQRFAILFRGLGVALALRQVLSDRVRAHRVERPGSERFRLLRARRRRVAKRLAHVLRNARHRAEDLRLVGRRRFRLRHRLRLVWRERANSHAVAAAGALDHSRQNHRNSYAGGDEASALLVERGTELQIPHHRRGVAARKGGDERRPFHGDAERLFQRAVEDSLPGAVLEVDDQNRDRRTRRRRGRAFAAALREIPRGRDQRGADDEHCRQALPRRAHPRSNARAALLVERFQLREHFGGRCVAGARQRAGDTSRRCGRAPAGRPAAAT